MNDDATTMPATTSPDTERPASVLICTDAAYDPDDAISLALAAFTVEDLTVITSDETGGRRARWTRRFLDLLGRPDVEVAAGPDIGEARRFLMDDMIADVPPQSTDVLGAVTRACERSPGPVAWIGQGPMTNLAAVVNAYPGLADRIRVTQQGGWLDHYRDKTRASHNLRLDPAAAGLALRTVLRPRLLLSDFTGVDDITVTAGDDLYRMLTAPGAPEWARWVAVNLSRWFDRDKPSRMHDPLALSAALGHPFVQFGDCRVRIEADARLYRDPDGRLIRVATAVDYRSFMAWLTGVLTAGLESTNPGQLQPSTVG